MNMNNEAYAATDLKTEAQPPRIEQLSGKYDVESMSQKLNLLPPAITIELEQRLSLIGMSLEEVQEHKESWLSDTETNRIISSHISTLYMHLATPKVISETIVSIAEELRIASEK